MPKTHTATVRVMKGGRVTIPINVRRVEHITEGMLVNVTIQKVPDAVDKKEQKS